MRFIIALVVLILGLYFLHHGLPWDKPIETYFYTPSCGAKEAVDCWLISKKSEDMTFWLHTVPRILSYGIAAIAGIVFISGYFQPRWRSYRLLGITILLSMGLTSGMVSALKSITSHYCPNQLTFYGGTMQQGVPMKHPAPRCYPASHPAAAFSLIAVAFAPLARRWRIAVPSVGFVLGCALSWVQMARGEHFLSHTVATFLVALTMGVIINLALSAKKLASLR